MIRVLSGIALCVAVSCQAALAGSVSSTVPMDGSQEVGPVATPATGEVSVTLNLVSGNLLVSGSYADLLADISGSHLHHAPVGVNGPVVVPLANTGGTTGTLSGAQVLTAAQMIQLIYGDWYGNVHSTLHPGGEIRGQLFPTGLQLTSTFGLDPGQEVPPAVGSSGLGSGAVTLDTGADTLSVMVSYSDLTGVAQAAHIHLAPVGVNGGVIVDLTGGISEPGTPGNGTINVLVPDISTVLTDQQLVDLLNGNTYINIHTASFPGGEIRGQITAVPEPATWALLAAGGALTLRLRRRRTA